MTSQPHSTAVSAVDFESTDEGSNPSGVAKDESYPNLIAHKVRGEPAFDIAIQMECPECLGQSCSECDDLGYWWIIPTSGHRAYPYWHALLEEIDDRFDAVEVLTTMPESIPDHYITHAAPASSKQSLTSLLGLHLRQPSPQIKRRV